MNTQYYLITKNIIEPSSLSLDEIYKTQNNDVVLVPRGYHPVVAGHGYNCYYLNFLTNYYMFLLPFFYLV